jgi:hypothetical protein
VRRLPAIGPAWECGGADADLAAKERRDIRAGVTRSRRLSEGGWVRLNSGGSHTVNHPGKDKGYEDGIDENRQDDPRNPPHDVRPGATSSLWNSSASIQCLHFAYRRKRRVPRRKKLWFGSQTESGAKRVPLPWPRTGAGVHGAAAQQDRTEETRSSRRAGSSLVVLAAAREPTRQESVVAVRGA